MFTIAWSFDLFWSVWLIKTENDAIHRMHRIHAETKSTDYRKCNNEKEVADEMRKKTKTYTQNSPIPSQRKEINSFYHECAKWNFRSLNRNDSGKNRKPIATFLHSSPATNQDSDNLFWKLITLFLCFNAVFFATKDFKWNSVGETIEIVGIIEIAMYNLIFLYGKLHRKRELVTFFYLFFNPQKCPLKICNCAFTSCENYALHICNNKKMMMMLGLVSCKWVSIRPVHPMFRHAQQLS